MRTPKLHGDAQRASATVAGSDGGMHSVPEVYDSRVSNEQHPSPTVIVARRVQTGREDDFRAWFRKAKEAASRRDGFLHADIQPPDASHPREWVAVYSFASIDQLEQWLASDERRILVADLDEIIDGPSREQRVAGLRTTPEPVTVVFSQRIAPDRHTEYSALYAEVADLMGAFPGFLGSELLEPVGGVQDDHVVVASFTSRTHLDRWLESPERRQWLTRAETLIEGDRMVNVLGGFAGWFPAQATQPTGPKRWKQAVVVFIALYPTSLAITLVRNEIDPSMNVALGVLVANVLGILALTYLLMPPLTRALARWLGR